MTDTDTNGGKAIAQNVNGFAELYPRQITYQEWRVLSTRGDEVTSHVVNLNAGTCDCEDMQYNKADDGPEICDHLAVALYQAPERISMDAEGFREFATLLSDAREATRALEDYARPARMKASEPEAVSNPSAESDDSDDNDPDDSDDELVEAEPNDQQEQLMREVQAWLQTAEDFDPQVDASIVSVEWKKLNGTEGVHLDMAPWNGDGYYSNGSWDDKDAYDEARDATAQLFADRDAIEYTGPPDYINFLPEGDVKEVTG